MTHPQRIPGKGLTEEAKAALNLEQTDLPEIDLDLDIDSAEVDADTSLPLFSDSGDYIEGRRLRQRPLPTPSPRDANKNIPTINEWMDFFSRIFLRVVCDWYISFAFRGIEEEWLSDREVDRLQLSDEERKRIAVPLSELSNKSKLMRKYGRTIVASGGAFDALITLGTWASRVNRIAAKYRKNLPVSGKVEYERTGPDAQAAGANGGHIGPNWTVVNPGG